MSRSALALPPSPTRLKKARACHLSETSVPRCVLLVLLCTAAAVLGVVGYDYARSADEERFRVAFREFGLGLAVPFGTALTAFEGLTKTIAATLALLQPAGISTPPYGLLANFSDFVVPLLSSTSASVVEYIPIIPAAQAFARANAASLGPGAGAVDLSAGVHGVDAAGQAVPFNAFQPYAAPLWQFAPFAANATDGAGNVSVLLFDLASVPDRAGSIACALATRQPCITPFTVYLGASGDGVLGYTSFVYSPIVSLATGGSVSSVVGVGIDWASVLRGALPELAGVIVDVVIASTGGSTLSLNIAGVDSFSLSVGDMHESAFDSLALTSTASLGTNFTITVYPTSAMEATFRTSDAAKLAAASAGTVLVLALVFLVYDFAVRRRIAAAARAQAAAERRARGAEAAALNNLRSALSSGGLLSETAILDAGAETFLALFPELSATSPAAGLILATTVPDAAAGGRGGGGGGGCRGSGDGGGGGGGGGGGWGGSGGRGGGAAPQWDLPGASLFGASSPSPTTRHHHKSRSEPCASGAAAATTGGGGGNGSFSLSSHASSSPSSAAAAAPPPPLPPAPFEPTLRVSALRVVCSDEALSAALCRLAPLARGGSAAAACSAMSSAASLLDSGTQPGRLAAFMDWAAGAEEAGGCGGVAAAAEAAAARRGGGAHKRGRSSPHIPVLIRESASVTAGGGLSAVSSDGASSAVSSPTTTSPHSHQQQHASWSSRRAVTAALTAGGMTVGFVCLHLGPAEGATAAVDARTGPILRSGSNRLAGAGAGLSGENGTTAVGASPRPSVWARLRAALGLPPPPLPRDYRRSIHDPNTPRGWASLREACDLLGSAVFVSRAFAATAEAVDEGLAAGGVPDAAGPAGMTSLLRQPSLRRRAGLRGCGGGGGGAASSPAFSSAFSPQANLSPTSADLQRSASAAIEALDRIHPAIDARLAAGFDLDSAEMSTAECRETLLHIFHAAGLLRGFRIPPASMAAFLEAVEAAYSAPNAFHTFRHAFNVAHAAWELLRCGALLRAPIPYGSLDALALLLAAVLHDAEHPGRINAFEIGAGIPAAVRYNDVSPAENWSAALGSALIEQHGLLAGLDAAEKVTFRKMFLAAVLATDMGSHKKLVARVAERANRASRGSTGAPHAATAGGGGSGGGPRASISFEVASFEERMLDVSFVLHCADLCNPLYPPSVSRRNAEALSAEFEEQAAAEKALGLPVSVMQAPDRAAKARMELSFINFVVRPLFKTLADSVPRLAFLLARIDANVAAWASVGAS